MEFNLRNILFAYAVTYRHLSWQTISQEISPEETHDFLTSILNVSSNLSNDENFASSDMAITSGALKANQMPNMNPELVKAARSDVMDIIRGPGGSDEYDDSLYMLAALSDLKAIITKGQAVCSPEFVDMGIHMNEILPDGSVFWGYGKRRNTTMQ